MLLAALERDGFNGRNAAMSPHLPFASPSSPGPIYPAKWRSWAGWKSEPGVMELSENGAELPPLTTVQGGHGLACQRRVGCLLSLALLCQGDLCFESGSSLCAHIPAAGRTDFTRAALKAGKSHSHFQVSLCQVWSHLKL